MTDTNQAESKLVYLPRSEAEGTYEALSHYLRAFGSDSDAYGQASIRAFRRANGEDGYLWEHMWYGRNHQKIQVGDTVRRQSVGDDPEFVEATVLAVTTYAALVDDGLVGVSWEVWPLIHRLDRLHTEPDFDHTHWVPVQRHMGYQAQPADAAAYEALLAGRGAGRHLSAVPAGTEAAPTALDEDGAAGELAAGAVGDDGSPDADD